MKLQPSPGAWRGSALPLCALALLAFAAYLPALGGGFVWDDGSIVERSTLLRGPLWRIWLTTDAKDFWPLTWTSLWLEWRLWGLSPAGYHATNVALHALTAILLWRVLLRLRVPGAWLGAALFAVHPVTVESVAWISERKNVLSAALLLGAALQWLAWEEQGRRARWWAALGLFVAALLAKASVVMFPVVLLGRRLLQRGRLERRDVLDTAPLFATSLAAGLVNVWFQHRFALAGAEDSARGLVERVGGAGWALASYLETAFMPARIGVVYPAWPVAPGSALWFAPLALAVAAFALLWRARARAWARLTLGALGFHAITVLPVLGLLDMAYLHIGPVSNHLQYVPLMGPAALLGAAGATLARRLALPRNVALAGTALLLLGLGAWTWRRAGAFESDLALWERAVAEQPRSVMALLQWSGVLGEAGRVEESMRAQERALALDPSPLTRLKIEMQLAVERGDRAGAEEKARALLSASRDLDARRDAAVTLIWTGDHATAGEVLGAAVRENPASSDYVYWYGAALMHQRRVDEALAALQAFSARRPGHPDIEQAIALVLVQTGHVGDALRHAGLAAGVDARDPRAAAQLEEWRKVWTAP